MLHGRSEAMLVDPPIRWELSMLVSHRHRFIYLKTKKTAGTSIEKALEPFARPLGELAAWTHAAPMAVSEAGIVGGRGKGSRHEAWHSHMPAAQVREQLGAEIWRDYTKICAVRNPWDKVVSFFHMARPRVKERPQHQIFERFRRFVAEEDDLGEDLDTFAIDGRLVADQVIRYETLAGDFARVCAAIGIAAPALDAIKADTRGEAKIDYRDYYDAPTRERVAARFARDIELLGWTFG